MSDQAKNWGEQRFHYNIQKWKKRPSDIPHDISENVTLVQLMNSFVNVNHAVSIVGYCIFDSNKRRRFR